MAGHDETVGRTIEQVLAGNSQIINEDTADKLERMATLLAKKLGPEHLANRQGGGGSKLTYIEGWRVISLANEVFGFNGWSSEVRDMNVDYVDYNQETQRWNMGVTATVRVTLKGGTFHEDVGIGKMENSKSKGDALDKIKKEAVTDGLKRALRTFGNLLGNCIYDKHYLEDIAKVKAPPRPKLDFNELHRGNHVANRPGFPAAPAPAPVQPQQPQQPVAGPSKARQGNVPNRPQPAGPNTNNNARGNMPPPRQPLTNAAQTTRSNQAPNRNVTTAVNPTVAPANVAPLTMHNLQNHTTQQIAAQDPDTSTNDYWPDGGEDDSLLDEITEDPEFNQALGGVDAQAEDSGFADVADRSMQAAALKPANYANNTNRLNQAPPRPANQGQNGGQAKPAPQRVQQIQNRVQPPRRQSIPNSSTPQQRQPPSRNAGQCQQARSRVQDGAAEMEEDVLNQDASFYGGDGFGAPPTGEIPAKAAFQNARTLKREFDEGPGQRSQSTSFETAQSGTRNISPGAAARIEQNKAQAQALMQAKRQKNASGEAAQR